LTYHCCTQSEVRGTNLVRPLKLLKTSIVRMALQHTVLYAAILGILMVTLYLSSTRYVNAQLKSDLKQELISLIRIFNIDGSNHLTNLISGFNEYALNEGRLYLLAKENGLPLAGNLTKWPHEADVLIDNGGIRNIWLDDDIMMGNFYKNDAYLPAIAHEFSDGSRLLIAYGVEQDNLIRELSENLLESFGAVLLFMLLLSITLGRAVLRRIETISRTAGEIMAGDLSQRIPISKRYDEFDILAQRLNSMLERIEKTLQSLREVTDNAAHDLKSPIARIRNRMEVILLQKQRDEVEYREVMEQTIKDADIMVKTFNAVLQTAQADAETIRADLLPVDLSRLVREIGELFTPAAEDAGLTLRIECEESISITGNSDLLAQAIGNLLDNAVKFTPPNGMLSLELIKTRSNADVIITDNGPGIPENERRHVKQRFVRLDSTRQTEGNGLGLSLVDAIARQHGAALLFEDNAPGLRAIIRFRTDASVF